MSEADLHALLQTFSSSGKEFEELCRWYLLNDPVYHAQLAKVWMWDDWPGRWGIDAGIDLVAEARDGRLWAIQAKNHDPKYWIKKDDIKSFLSESARRVISYRLLIATTDRLGANAKQAMLGQEKPVGQILLHDLERAEVRWPTSITDLRPARPERKDARDHQQEAIDAVITGFNQADRGQLIMACGTGKTLVSLWITEALGAERTLVLVPSLSLLRQTIREWELNKNREFESLPVCSDETVAEHDQMVASVAELGFPATGDPAEVRAFLERPGPRVVFSTYQSSPVVAAAMAAGAPGFDLALADEAHRCAGRASSDFATILDAEKIPATKRLFMTATPRYFTEKVREAGIDDDFEIASMDDDVRFGKVLHRLSFGEAIDRDLLSDYRVLVIGVDDEMYRRYAEHRRFVTRDGKEVTDARTLAAQIGLAKAIKKYDLGRTITFHSRVEAAKDFAESLPYVIDWMPADERPVGDLWADHVSGEMNSSQREARLRQLRGTEPGQHGVLANVRCLSEGVDVPTLDGVAFIDPKQSEVDIAQAVGRAIRKADDKQFGKVLIPVFVGAGDDPETAIEESAFKRVGQVVRALRDHDAQLGGALDELRRSLGRRESVQIRIPDKIVIEMPAHVGEDFVRAFETQLIERVTASWEFWFGLLEKFRERHGDARVPTHHKEGQHLLGLWVSNQRKQYKQKTIDPDRALRLDAFTGWEWDEPTALWEDGFAALSAFEAREKHARVFKRHKEEDGYPLGEWVGTQRRDYKNGRLEPERIERLQKLRKWTWDEFAAAWEEHYAALCAFVARKGHARVRAGHVEDGLALGNWCTTQKSDYRKGKLDQERIDLLNSVPGWEFTRGRYTWEEAFAAVCAFVDREQHAIVPKDHKEDGIKLRRWVERQRTAYRKGRLEPEQIELLTSLQSWGWTDYEAAWERAFAALSAFANRNQHIRVPPYYTGGGVKLQSWLSNQQTAYVNQELELDRMQRLEALPGWEARQTKQAAWEKGYTALCAFVARTDTANAEMRHVDEEGFPLGRWVNRQRTAYRQGTLQPDLIDRLAALGFEWTVRERTNWQDGFDELSVFVDREGHANVEKSQDQGDFLLGNWVHLQQRAYREGRLEPEQIELLTSLQGWAWTARDRKSEQAFAALLAFAKREGHAVVPRPHVERGVKLGEQVKTWRRLYREGELEQEWIDRLTSVQGWDWAPRKGPRVLGGE